MLKCERYTYHFFILLLVTCCTSTKPSEETSNEVKILAAKQEMRIVEYGLKTYQIEDRWGLFPTASQITSHSTLMSILSPYVTIPAAKEAAWIFVSYSSSPGDSYLLQGRAKDQDRTDIVMAFQSEPLYAISDIEGMWEGHSTYPAYSGDSLSVLGDAFGHIRGMNHTTGCSLYAYFDETFVYQHRGWGTYDMIEGPWYWDWHDKSKTEATISWYSWDDPYLNQLFFVRKSLLP